MHILGKDWRNDYLDYARSADEYRVQVRNWVVVSSLDDLFYSYPRDPFRIFAYWRKVGTRNVIRKIRSRLAERMRDKKVLAVGLGTVLEAPHGSDLSVGDTVAFVAPCHPECVERVVLPRPFLHKVEGAFAAAGANSADILYLKSGAMHLSQQRVRSVAGWSRHSGTDVAAEAQALVAEAAEVLKNRRLPGYRALPTPNPSRVMERTDAKPMAAEKHAVLFGLGHYAKTNIIPNLDPRLHLSCVHELDPSQIGRLSSRTLAFDTSAEIRPDEKYDVYFLAGYHHTHAPQAVHALRQGAWVVSEKPLATTWQQLEELMKALAEHPGKFFAGFHRRFHPIWGPIRQLLNPQGARPIHYQCVVFERPGPANHWYHWPNSRSKMVSNGCHWLDHFLLLNDWSPPRRHQIWVGCNDDVHTSVELTNGAVFSMVLTDCGSDRLGVRETVRLSSEGTTFFLDEDGRYLTEDSQRVLRRGWLKRVDAYEQMYRTISRRIMMNQPGDSLESVKVSTELMLLLNDEYEQAAKSGDPRR